MPEGDAPLSTPSDESARGRAVGGRIARASLLITLAYAIFKVLSLAQSMVVNAYCDTATVNLFDFGYTHVLMLFFLVGEEAISPALLPLFIRRRDEEGPDSAWRLANSVLTAQALLIGLAAAAVAWNPEFVVDRLTGWKDAGANPVYREYAPRYARAMAPAMVFICLTSTTYMLLSAKKRFFWAAVGDAMLKVGVIASVGVGVALAAAPDASGRLRLEGEAALRVFAAGALLGALAKLGTHLLGLGAEARRIRPRFDWRSPAFKRFLWLLLPLLAGILFARFRDLFSNLYVVSKIQEDLGDGLTGGALMKANQNGVRLFRSLAQVVPMAVSVAMLPFLCEMVDRRRADRLGRTVTASSRLMLLLFAPMAAMMLPLSLPLVQTLFLRGQFSALDAELTATSNMCYSLVLPFVALEPLLMNVYFSQRRTVMISVAGIVFSSLTVLTNALGVFYFGLRGPEVLVLLGLSFTGWRIVKVLFFAWVMRRGLPCFPARETLAFLGRLAAISAAAGLAAWGARLGMESLAQRWISPEDLAGGGGRVLLLRALGFLAVPGAAGTFVALGGAWFFLRSDLRLLIDWFRERLNKRRG